MEKEAQKPQIAPPRIRNIDEVLRELRGNQAHLPTHMVSLTEEKYFPSEAMAKVENIATLMDATMDEDFLERCLNIKRLDFYISSKDIPREIIDSLESLGSNDDDVCVRIDREKRTLNPISKSQYDVLNPNERGVLRRTILKGINEGRLLYIGFYRTVWRVGDPSYYVNEGPFQVAFTESTD